MAYLFFDTETDGLPTYDAPITSPVQPNILSIGMILTDEVGREMSVFKSAISLPIGIKIDEKGRAFEVNKLGNDLLAKYGFDMRLALDMFRQLSNRATVKVAHNYRFDGFLMKGAHEKLGVDPGPVIEKYDTMKVMMENKGKPGFPSTAKLSDCYQHITGKPLDGAHDALADVRACKDLFFWIKSKGLYKPQPRVVPGEKAA